MDLGSLIAIGYGLISLFASRIIYSYMRADFLGIDGKFDLGDTVSCGFFAFIGGWFWPLALPIAIIVWKPRKSEAERREERRKREAYIRKLEKELGIHDR